jgi:predicted metal-dependent phosphoesterase TrpH
VIDLHTHTTASDGCCTPAELVARAAAGGVTVLGLTDHDTVAACEETAAACGRAGIEFVRGIEITAVAEGIDVHVLGYFIDVRSRALAEFLSAQRRQRIDRVRRIVARLAEHGIALDGDAIVAPALADPSRSAGRPWVARALVAAGHAADTDEAFGRWLAHGRPAFVPRIGARPEEVFERVHEAGGVASLAHPVLVGHDEWIPSFAAAGMDALEAYHCDHDAHATKHYLELAGRHHLAVTGGSDYHGDATHCPSPGSVSLPQQAYETLVRLSRVRLRTPASGNPEPH